MIRKGTLKNLILKRIGSKGVQFGENMRQILFDEIKDDARYLYIDDSEDRFINLASKILKYMLDFGGEAPQRMMMRSLRSNCTKG